MPDPSRRLSEADAIFLPMGAAVGGEMAPLSVEVLEGPLDPAAAAHQRELQARLLPAMRRRIVRDRFSTALPRWVDVAGAQPEDNWMELDPPGDGTLRAVLDWTARWARLPFPEDRSPWRCVRFDGVDVDGVPRTVIVSQVHHALIDGGGARRMVEHLLRFDPDAPLAPMPPLPEPEEITAWDRWKEGWAVEGRKVRASAKTTGARLRWAAREPG
ncbi:MAG TPA: wax ester/triacylglycerol synthase domain-containing protein, partial [Acidimicrobiales bacterium]|nr:wax ester/triacylglycerol synthase domain-containing protein [Acidimicrobiales bacterium]